MARGGGSTSSEKKNKNKNKTKEPAFFKIIKTGFTTDKLRIPPKFRKHILNEVSGTAILKLKGSMDQSWTVVVSRIGQEIYLTNGWHEFVRDNSLGNFEFLVFQYEREHMHFSIEIYDRNACIRRCHKSAATHGAPWRDVNEITAEEEDQEEEEATTLLDSDLPTFMSTIGVALHLGVPTGFSRKHLPRGYYYILLENSEGIEWRVKIIPSNTTVKISQGWTEFKRANGIKRGDICIFKLVKRNRMVVHVDHLT